MHFKPYILGVDSNYTTKLKTKLYSLSYKSNIRLLKSYLHGKNKLVSYKSNIRLLKSYLHGKNKLHIQQFCAINAHLVSYQCQALKSFRARISCFGKNYKDRLRLHHLPS
jgi:hypothetical protein